MKESIRKTRIIAPSLTLEGWNMNIIPNRSILNDHLHSFVYTPFGRAHPGTIFGKVFLIFSMKDVEVDSLAKDTVIWEGRFQPVHLGHIHYIRTLLSIGKPVWLYMVNNERSSDLPTIQSPVPDFTAVVDTHHRAEKNPLPFWLRYQLLTATMVGEFGNDAALTIWGGRRLDLNWPFVKKALPPVRKFILSRRDDFEDAKASAWVSLGERVERVQGLDGPEFSATDFREAVVKREPIDHFLSEHTLHALDKMQIREAFFQAIYKAIAHER